VWILTDPGVLQGGTGTATLRIEFDDGTVQTMEFPLLGPSGK